MCQKYSLESKDEWDRGIVRNEINSIKMIVEKGSNRIALYICSDPSKNRGELPKSSDGKFAAGKYSLECYDDEILIKAGKGIQVTIDKWLKSE